MPDKPTIRETVRIRLEELSDPEYRNSTAGFCRESPASWGVRTPELRGIAKDLKKSGWREYIKRGIVCLEGKGPGSRRRSLR